MVDNNIQKNMINLFIKANGKMDLKMERDNYIKIKS